MPTMTPIHAAGTARPVGHYSQAVIANGFVFVSGQVPSDLATGTPLVGSIEEQTEASLGNVRRILEAAGCGLEDTIQMTIFISRIEDWGAVNQTYARIMGGHRPTRAIVPVSPLHYGTGIEIQCVAVLPKRTARGPQTAKRPARKRPTAKPRAAKRRATKRPVRRSR